MNNTGITRNQYYQNQLPTTQSYSIQNLNTTSIYSAESRDNETHSIQLVDDNGSGINSAIIDGGYRNRENEKESQDNGSDMIFTKQSDITTARQIQIKSQPRKEYHPRTTKESKRVAHFIRCDEDKKLKYPTIYTISNWKKESKANSIEVALVDINRQPHPYTIDSKARNSSEGQQLVSKSNDGASNILFFALTDKHFDDACITFKIELIKSKQVDNISKELICERQLEKSMLRFTRVFYDERGVYHRDEDSTVYSRIMIEKYGDVTVDYVNPNYGPMSGNQRLNIVFKGLKAQDRKKLSFEIVGQKPQWQLKVKKLHFVGNIVDFQMPAFPNPLEKKIMTSVIVYYEGEAIHEFPFLYIAALDLILNEFNLNEPNQVDAESTTSSNNSNFNQDLASNSCSSSVVSKKKTAKNSKKRKRVD